MGKIDYDQLIEQHYKNEALQHGLKPTSTMLDKTIRKRETDAIIHFVGESIRRRISEGLNEPATIMDIGCGNGYTLKALSQHYPDQYLVGFEKSHDLRKLAESRFVNNKRVSIIEADIRKKDFSNGTFADILICQRVLINILSVDDQKRALKNLVNATRSPDSKYSGGTLIFIESFKPPLTRLNRARKEFSLPPTKPAYHNLYLRDDFFAIPELKALDLEGVLMAPNFLSTHYFIARVIYPLFSKDKSISRNSELVDFFVAALHQNVGDYSPLKLFTFEKQKSTIRKSGKKF